VFPPAAHLCLHHCAANTWLISRFSIWETFCKWTGRLLAGLEFVRARQRIRTRGPEFWVVSVARPGCRILSRRAARTGIERSKMFGMLLPGSERDISSCTRYSHRSAPLDHAPVMRSCAACTGLYSPVPRRGFQPASTCAHSHLRRITITGSRSDSTFECNSTTRLL